MKALKTVVIVFFLSNFCCYAQLNYPSGTMVFDGIHTFRRDSALQDLVQKQKVKSISQIIATPNYTLTYGEFFYNEQSQITRMHTQSYTVGYEYSGTLRTKELHYNKKDSLESWTDYVYDEKKRLVKTIRNYYSQGKLISYTENETKPIAEDANKKRWETTRYGINDIYTIKYSLDSTANNIHYYIEYEYRPKDVDQKGRKTGDKKMTRSYIKDNCRYEDIVKYKVYGRLESTKDIETHYYQGDEKGRLIEYGDLDYEKGMMQYISEHPEQYLYGAYPTGLVKAILDGQLSAERKAKITQVYDANGRLIEKKHYDKRYSFKYNSKGQLIEQVTQGNYPATDTIYYNKNGLISRIVTTGYTLKSGDKTVVLEESNFIYTYY